MHVISLVEVMCGTRFFTLFHIPTECTASHRIAPQYHQININQKVTHKQSSGRPMKLSLYGHSVCTDRTANTGSVLIFGGKESSDTKEFETKRALSTRHFWRLDATSGVVEPVVTKDSPPENRYVQIIVRDTDMAFQNIINKIITFKNM